MRRRVVLLGASNLTRGLAGVLGALQRQWPEDQLDVFAALGHGRSYGAKSFLVGRSLPGILQSRLWSALAEESLDRSSTATHALVTDIGNDILYGFAPERIGGWIGETLARLAEAGAQTTITGLPLDSVRSLDRHRFLVFKRLFFPLSRIEFEDAVAGAIATDALVREQAERHGARVVEQRGEWYGVDPIHFKLSQSASAWSAILAPFAEEELRPRFSPARWTWLKTRRPREMFWLGVPLGGRQPCGRLPHGGSLSLY